MLSPAYEAIADTRPRIRRDVLFTETGQGVLFHNAQTGFHLGAKAAYRFTSLIVPFLNGENRVADICSDLGDGQRAMVTDLVQTLYRRGFARDIPPVRPGSPQLDPEVAGRFAPQIAYIEHHVDDAAERFERYRTARVAVLGDDLIARWCALSLIRNGAWSVGVLAGIDSSENRFADVRAEAAALSAQGCPATVRTFGAAGRLVGWEELAAYDIVVVTGGRAGPAQIHHLLREGIPPRRSLLPAWVFGDRVVVGPLTTQGSTGCWGCAALRLGANVDASAAADMWSEIALPQPGDPGARRPSRPLAAMIGNLLGYEVFRLTTGALPAETDRQLLIQELDSLDVVAEPLLPHPRCPYGRTAPSHGNPDVSVHHEEAPTPAGPAAPERDADVMMEELSARQLLVAPHSGVFTRFVDERLTQTPLKLSTVDVALGHGKRRRIGAADIHHVVGARLRAIAGAAAVYAEHVASTDAITGDELSEARAATPSVAPPFLGTASGLDIPAADIEAWRKATSIVTGESALIPAGAVYTFGSFNAQRFCVPTRAGWGVGASPAAASARALLSALSYDAIIGAVRGRTPVALVSPRTISIDAELTFLMRSAANLDVEVELLQIGDAADVSAHVLLARETVDRHGPGAWAVGAETSWRAAAVAALRDLLGHAQLRRELSPGELVDGGDPLVADLDAATLPVDEEISAPSSTESGGGSLPNPVRNLPHTGRDALLVPATTGDLRAGGLATAKVVLVNGTPDAP